MDAIIGAVGPLARSLADLSLFCSSILSHEISPWNMEAQTMYHPWKEIFHPSNHKLAIAVMFDDGVVCPHPPILAAMEHTIARLKAEGHRIIPWEPYKTREADNLLFTLLLQDQGEEYRDHMDLSGEPPIPMIDWLLDEKSPRQPVSTPRELWRLSVLREKLRQEALDRWSQLESRLGCPVDAILCPGAPTLAPRHDKSRHWIYTAMWNVLDWPAVAFPIPSIKHDTASPHTSWPPHGPRSSLEAQVWGEWHDEWYRDAPVGLQLVGRRLQEEKLLADLGVIEASIQHIE